MKKALMLSVASLFVPSSALAQSPAEPPRYGLEASWEHAPGGFPLIGYSREVSGRWITEFYAMARLNAETEPVIFARRALDSYVAQEHIRWADSRTCPSLIPQLLRANDLPMPIVIIPLDDSSRARRDTTGPPAVAAPDGPGPFVFWAISFGQAGREVRFSTYGGPWHAWANVMESNLERCWSDEKPRIGSTG